MERQDLFDALTMRFSDVAARRDVLRTLGTLVLAMVVFGAFPWRVRADEIEAGEPARQGLQAAGPEVQGWRR